MEKIIEDEVLEELKKSKQKTRRMVLDYARSVHKTRQYTGSESEPYRPRITPEVMAGFINEYGTDEIIRGKDSIAEDSNMPDFVIWKDIEDKRFKSYEEVLSKWFLRLIDLIDKR